MKDIFPQNFLGFAKGQGVNGRILKGKLIEQKLKEGTLKKGEYNKCTAELFEHILSYLLGGKSSIDIENLVPKKKKFKTAEAEKRFNDSEEGKKFNDYRKKAIKELREKGERERFKKLIDDSKTFKPACKNLYNLLTVSKEFFRHLEKGEAKESGYFKLLNDSYWQLMKSNEHAEKDFLISFVKSFKTHLNVLDTDYATFEKNIKEECFIIFKEKAKGLNASFPEPPQGFNFENAFNNINARCQRLSFAIGILIFSGICSLIAPALVWLLLSQFGNNDLNPGDRAAMIGFVAMIVYTITVMPVHLAMSCVVPVLLSCGDRNRMAEALSDDNLFLCPDIQDSVRVTSARSNYMSLYLDPLHLIKHLFQLCVACLSENNQENSPSLRQDQAYFEWEEKKGAFENQLADLQKFLQCVSNLDPARFSIYLEAVLKLDIDKPVSDKTSENEVIIREEKDDEFISPSVKQNEINVDTAKKISVFFKSLPKEIDKIRHDLKENTVGEVKVDVDKRSVSETERLIPK